MRVGYVDEPPFYWTAADGSATRLGLIHGQVQLDAARTAGVPSEQIVSFAGQQEAVAALIAGSIDAFAATAIGNRVVVAGAPELESVPFPESGAVGAFSFALVSSTLLTDVNEGLRRYLGSDDHRARMAEFGLTGEEIDGALRTDS